MRGKMKLDYVAKLVIHKADKLTDKKAQKLSSWLKHLAYTVEDEHDRFSSRFTAHLMR